MERACSERAGRDVASLARGAGAPGGIEGDREVSGFVADLARSLRGSPYDVRVSSEPLCILFVVHGFTPEFRGGTETYCLKAAQALQARGHRVEVLAGSMEEKEPPALETSKVGGVRVHRVHRQGLFLESWDKSHAPDVGAFFREVLRKVRPDVVHVHHWLRLSRNLVALSHREGVPAVVTLHDLWSSCPRVFRIRAESFCNRSLSVESCLDCVPRDPWLTDREVSDEIELFRDDFRQELKLARRVIVPSKAQKEIVVRVLEMAGGRFRVLPHGAITELPRGAPPSEGSKIRLGHWGHLSPMKGFHLLLEALRELPVETRARFEVACWGEASDPAYGERLDALADGLAVTRHGAYAPEDLEGASLDWAVIPSTAHESYSFVLDEAFQLGLPVIVSRRGALAERVGGAGLVFEPEDRLSLRDALQQIAAQPEMAAECRDAIPELPSLASHAVQLERLYGEVRLREGDSLALGSEELEDRHTRQRTFRHELRVRQLLDARGNVTKEQHRVEGLELEMEKAEAGMGKAQVTITQFKESLEEHRREMVRLESERDHLNEQAGREIARLRAIVDEGSQQLIGEVTQRRRVEAELHEALQGVDGYRKVVADVQARSDRLRSTCEEARRREAELDDALTHARELGTQVAEESARTKDALASLERTAADTQSTLERELDAKRQELEKLTRTRATLSRRVAELDGAARHMQVLGEDAAARLVELGRELGLGVDSGAPSLASLPELLETMVPLIIRNRNLMGEMVASLDGLTGEAEKMHVELSQAEEALESERQVRRARRRYFWYRWVERLASKSLPVQEEEAPPSRGGLRILMVLHDFLPRHAAGSEIYTYHIAKALMARHDVHLVFTEARAGVHSYQIRRGRYDGIPYTEISHQHTTAYFERTWRDPMIERLFEEILDQHHPDVVHFQHLHHLSINCITLAKERGIPVIYTLHEYMLLCPRGGQMLREDLEVCARPIPEKCADCIAHYSLETPPDDEGRARLATRIARHLPVGVKQALKRLRPEPLPAAPAPAADKNAYAAAISHRLETIKEVLTDVDLFISPSEFLRQKFIDCGLVREDQIIFSDNGQDSRPFEGIRRRPSRNLRVGYIGTISDYKGVHVLVDAMDALVDIPDLECHIHGSLESFPDYAHGLEARSRNPRTRFHGRYENGKVGEVLAGLDLLVVPSLWYENSPLTIHEAYIAGLPVVASDLGGMAEFVHEGKNGLLFRPGDADDLARRLREVAVDRSMLERLRNTTVPIKSIAEDAALTEQRYLELTGRDPTS